jgi:NADH:ubiquinone reductase (H+-translocating)
MKPETSANRPWRVIIAGGGFGGLRAAQALDSDLFDVTVIDRRTYHLYQPLLSQVATGSLSAGQISAAPKKLAKQAKEHARPSGLGGRCRPRLKAGVPS